MKFQKDNLKMTSIKTNNNQKNKDQILKIEK
jgi:hypothetical protein